MSDAPLMLGVSGLRGIVGKSLTPEVARAFARAFGEWLTRRGRSLDRPAPFDVRRPLVVLSADGRTGFEVIRDAAVLGLRQAGCSVMDIGVAMTPTTGIVVDHEDADGGMIVTASHNPQEWNGLKCLVRDAIGGIGGQYVSASAPSAAIAGQIIEVFRSGAASPSQEGLAISVESSDCGEHLGPVMQGIEALADFNPLKMSTCRVVLDSVNAAGIGGGRALLRDALGCELVHIGAEATGLFPHPPEPLRENLTGLADAVKRSGAHVGFAQDPDADRLAIVDERGEYIGEEYTLALAAEALLAAAKPSGKERVLVTNLSTSRMIDDIAARHGARVLRTPVGEANVVEVMKRERDAGRDVVLGGEGNGGVIWPLVTYVRDSLSSMALVLALMARTGKTVSQLVGDIPAYAIEKRKVDLARKEDARPAVERIAAAYGDQRVDLQDGVRIDWDSRKAWLHVRASNTEPIMRLIAEAPTAAEAKRILDEAAKVIG